jgi:amino acid transporter
MFGVRAERVLSVFVALSAFGNVLSVIFSQGRCKSLPISRLNNDMLNAYQVVQEIGREGILPLSRLWASNKPRNAPFMGLFEHWLVSVIIMLAPPPGDAYNFILKSVSLSLPCKHLLINVQFDLLSPGRRQRIRSSWPHSPLPAPLLRAPQP